MPKPENTSVVAHPRSAPKRRNLRKVPFVELWAGRLQGVVSSGSSAKRVYVSFVEAGSTDFYCSTNNNRPCGGLGYGTCSHLGSLIGNAVSQFGAERVARYLQLDCDPGSISDPYEISNLITGNEKKEPPSEVFARFLNYLRIVDLPGGAEPLPEMAWFRTG